jgi:hypothetical protein
MTYQHQLYSSQRKLSPDVVVSVMIQNSKKGPTPENGWGSYIFAECIKNESGDYGSGLPGSS